MVDSAENMAGNGENMALQMVSGGDSQNQAPTIVGYFQHYRQAGGLIITAYTAPPKKNTTTAQNLHFHLVYIYIHITRAHKQMCIYIYIHAHTLLCLPMAEETCECVHILEHVSDCIKMYLIRGM